jgi:hypothetical protein
MVAKTSEMAELVANSWLKIVEETRGIFEVSREGRSSYTKEFIEFCKISKYRCLWIMEDHDSSGMRQANGLLRSGASLTDD